MERPETRSNQESRRTRLPKARGGSPSALDLDCNVPYNTIAIGQRILVDIPELFNDMKVAFVFNLHVCQNRATNRL